MPDTFDLTCPACQQTVHVDQPGDRVSMFCPRCGVSIPILDVAGSPLRRGPKLARGQVHGRNLPGRTDCRVLQRFLDRPGAALISGED